MTETDTQPMDPRLIEAELIKLAAETRKLESETEALKWDQEIKKAEARQKVAHALSAEHGAESMRIQTEATQRQEKLALVSNHHYHEYLFSEPVYDEAVEHCLAQLAIWDRLDPECDFTVTFRSPGGSVLAGMHLFDEIDRYSLRPWDTSDRPKGTHKTTGIVRGWAASMAGILLQAFDDRVIGRESWLMVHEVSSWAQGKVGDIQDELDFLKGISKRVANSFVERSGGKMTLDRFESDEGWKRREWYLDSAQTLACGFADRIG